MVDNAKRLGVWRRISIVLTQLPGIGSVMAAAAVLRFGSIPLVRTFRHANTWEFGPIAKNIEAGLGFTVLLRNGVRVPSAWEPPAFAYILAFFYRIGGETAGTYLAIELIQAALGVLLVYAVYRLTLILFDRKVAIVAAALVAVYPPLVYLCNEIHSISIYVLLEVATVLFLVRYLRVSRSWKDVIAAALCMGVTMLFRGEAPALLLMYAAILVFRGGRKSIAHAVVFVLIASACLAPWTIRNYRAFGKAVPVTNIGGWDLWLGHNPLASGSDRYNFLPLPADLQKALNDLPLDRTYEVEKDSVFKRFASQFMKTHPSQEAVLAFRKFSFFFLFDVTHTSCCLRRHPARKQTPCRGLVSHHVGGFRRGNRSCNHRPASIQDRNRSLPAYFCGKCPGSHLAPQAHCRRRRQKRCGAFARGGALRFVNLRRFVLRLFRIPWALRLGAARGQRKRSRPKPDLENRVYA
jgi:hypothetical protein